MRLAGLLVIFILLISCDAENIYDQNYEFTNKIWNVDTVPSFQFEIPSTQVDYDVSVNIRNTSSYPFQNLYLTYFLEDTSGTLLKKDLVNFQLFETKTGEPLGNGGLGDIYDYSFTVLDNYQFPEEGAYRMRVQQYMRRDSLPEIVAVGIRVEENKNED